MDPLVVVHQGKDFVVVEKPSGMLSVPGKGEGKQRCAASVVRELFPTGSGPLVVHRLDMETSGLMVFGLTEEAQRELSARFEARAVEKKYVALVEGVPHADEGTIDLPLRADITRRPLQIVDHAQGRPATTHWRVLSHETDRTRLELVPLTGRTHQLRVHMASGLGTPIVGDVLYGSGAGPRLMLHAACLAFVPPGGGRAVRFESRTPF